MQWQAAHDEVVEKAPPWKSRATRSQLQGKKEEKKKRVTRYNVSVANYINSLNNHLYHHLHMAFTSNTLWGMFSSLRSGR